MTIYGKLLKRDKLIPVFNGICETALLSMSYRTN